MKYFLKSFFIVVVLLVAFNFTHKVNAAESEFIEGTSCPKPPSDDYVSICGIVKHAMPQDKKLYDGTTAKVAGKGVENVSVYIYNGTNEGPTGFVNGDLVHAFSSTTTLKDGRFHIITSKLDSPVPIEYVNSEGEGEVSLIPKQTKTRYLVFRCGNRFAGMSVIPSFLNITDIVQEVVCPDTGLSYSGPPARLDFVMDTQKLANQMGIDDPDYEEENYSIQTTFKGNPPGGEINLYLKLEGADPRFTVPKGAKESLYTDALEGDYPDLGAWYSLDCVEKYKDTKWEKLCAYDVAKSAPMESGIYEEKLYKDANFTVQHALPNIPPSDGILFYKEFTARQDLTEYIQDPADIARFLGSQFSNCVGSVFARHVGEVREQDYPDCEIFKLCNETISSTDDYRNTFTTNGPAAALAAPTDYNTLKELIDPEVPVCVIDGQDDDPVKIGQIQPPDDLNPSGYRLSSKYWNSPHFLVYSNQEYSGTAKLGQRITTNATSLYTGAEDCSDIPFVAGQEGAGVPSANCTSVTFTDGGKARNNSLYVASIISSGNNSIGPITNWLSPPNKDEDYEKEIMSSVGNIYSVSGTAKKVGEYSKINPAVDKEITSPIDDKLVFDNSLFDAESKANENHWPFQDLGFAAIFTTLTNALLGVTDDSAIAYAESMSYTITDGTDGKEITFIKDGASVIMSLRDFKKIYKNEIIGFLVAQIDITKEGQRTPHSAVYITSAARNRIAALAGVADGQGQADKELLGNLDNKDSLDSALSTIYGTNDDQEIDWEKGETVFSRQSGFFAKVIALLTGASNDRKTFLDRKNVDFGGMEMIDSLKVSGFQVTEENFKELFPLPTRNSSLSPSDWGDGGACYPWHVVNECNTSTAESPDGLSRTCKVEYCKNTTVTVSCTCKNVGGVYDCEEPTVTIKPPSSDINNPNPDEEPCDASSTSGPEHETRYQCARQQKSLNSVGEVEKLHNGNEGSASNLIGKAKEDICGDNIIIENSSADTIERSETRALPYCVISMAGPNTCDGNLFQNSEVSIKQQTARPEQESVTFDTALADTELMKSFQSPSDMNLINLPGAFLTLKTSIGEDTSYDVSERLRTRGPGAASDDTIRSMFASPTTFGVNPEYKDVLYHCKNNLLGSTGLWDCNPPEVPDPEIIDINSLEVSDKCDLNYENPQCRSLVLGPDYDNFSNTFLKIINGAATKFKIPASMLLSYMMAIKMMGDDVNYTYSRYWSPQGESDLYALSAPWYGGFSYEPSCNDLVETDQGPYDWLIKWFGDALVTEGAGSALEELSVGRTNTASRCNFLDATYAVAAVLGDGTKCEDWTWARAANALDILTFGNPDDQKGTQATSSKYSERSYARQIFGACR